MRSEEDLPVSRGKRGARTVSFQVLGASLVLVAALTVYGSSSQEPQTPAAPSLESLGPEFGKLVSPDAKFETVPVEFPSNSSTKMSFGTFDHFTEGPVWNPRGFLLFSDIYGDRIYEWAKGSSGRPFRDGAGLPNGLTFDMQDRLLICNQKLRRVERLEKNGSVSVLASEWHGKKLNCPNDIVVRKDGTIYVTDPYWKFPPGSQQELSFTPVWKISPDGKLSIAAQDFDLPNGIAFSPDQKLLYIGDTKRKKLYALDVAVDGSLSNQREFADLQSKEAGAVDGMKVDEHGDIFTTGPGGVWVFSPAGKHLGTIHAPAIPANCAWGEKDYKTLFLATPKVMYSLRTNVRGSITYDVHGKNYPDLQNSK
jgi:gluconolactonase